jgi:hypothetical protein
VKWLFFSLILLNLALYLWASGHPEVNDKNLLVAKSEVNQRAMLLLSEAQSQVSARQGACLRIGPFQTQSTFADASRILEEMGLIYSKTAVSARKLKTWRVSMPAPKDNDELADLRSKLKDLDIEHYKFAESDTSYLSLGLFSQATDARVFVSRMSKDGIEASYRPELRTLGPLRWVELSREPDKFAVDKLQETRWGDAMAKVTQLPCPA